jgi:hypothetical protein
MDDRYQDLSYLNKDGSFSRPLTDRQRRLELEILYEDPRSWRPPRRGKVLDRLAPDPPWLVRAKEKAEKMRLRPIRILPQTWKYYLYEAYAPFVFYLGRAVKRELETDAEAVEIRLHYRHTREDNWVYRIEMDYEHPRKFTIEGLVDPGDFRTDPFFREVAVSFLTKMVFLPGPLWERNGELVAKEDFCIVLNEWSRETSGDGSREAGDGEIGPLRGTEIDQPPRTPAVPCPSSAEEASFSREARGHGNTSLGLLELMHKFIPPPSWWKRYCSPFKLPYSLWYASGPLPEWAEKRLYNRLSTEWPFLPAGEARERMEAWARRKWRNRKTYWKDGQSHSKTRRTAPYYSAKRDEKGVWRAPYSRSGKKLRRRKKAWRPGPALPKCIDLVKAPNGPPAKIPVYLTKAAAGQPGPWPKWKRRPELKAPRRGRPPKDARWVVWHRYLRAKPSLKITPLKKGARRYEVQARLIPLGQNIHLAELFEFERELQAALKSYSRKWCTMPKTKRVAMRDRIRETG